MSVSEEPTEVGVNCKCWLNLYQKLCCLESTVRLESPVCALFRELCAVQFLIRKYFMSTTVECFVINILYSTG